MHAFRLEGNSVITTLPDGKEIVASLEEQPGQAETAKLVGCTVRELNETHDAFHTLIAVALGLRYSPALWAAAHNEETTELHGIEEEAVLALQRYYFALKLEGVL